LKKSEIWGTFPLDLYGSQYSFMAGRLPLPYDINEDYTAYFNGLKRFHFTNIFIRIAKRT
jgi:hypothetical protein